MEKIIKDFKNHLELIKKYPDNFESIGDYRIFTNNKYFSLKKKLFDIEIIYIENFKNIFQFSNKNLIK